MSSPRTRPDLPSHVLHVMNAASGGAAATTRTLIAHLRDAGVASSIVCHTMGTDDDKRSLEHLVDGRALFTPLYWWNKKNRAALWKRPLIDARLLWATRLVKGSSRAVMDFAEENGADLIHTNTILTPEGALAARRLALPHVWHVRELVGPGQPFRFWREARRLRAWFADDATIIVANSSTTGRCVQALTGVDVRVVPNGIDLEPYLGITDPDPEGTAVVAGMIANLTSRWKQHDVFIEAAARVDPALGVTFRIVGEDPGRRDPYVERLLARAHELGLDGRLELVGSVEAPQDVYAPLDIVVHPAAKESFGRIAVEAMAAGRPVVGIAAGGIGELVEDGVTGLLCSPGDATGIARAVELLAGDGNRRRRMGEEGRRVAQRCYSAQAMTVAMLGVYRAAMLAAGATRP